MAREEGAGFILFREPAGPRQYLIINNKQTGHWGFPKGHIEPGEDELTAARREVAEEVGITGLAPQAGFRRELRYRFRRHHRPVDKRVTLFLGRVGDDAAVRPSPDEVADWAWLPYPEAVAKLTYPEQRELLRAAHRWLGARPG
ncbi:MAG: bis(5'-nucleosyl)-tetraphosphatase [Candidatus Bipolaricaulaceae bacterium]